jgi:hypothetical protein
MERQKKGGKAHYILYEKPNPTLLQVAQCAVAAGRYKNTQSVDIFPVLFNNLKKSVT